MRNLSYYISLLCAVATALGANASLTFTGAADVVINIDAPASSGLNQVYVLSSTSRVTASYTARSSDVRWLCYSNLGGGYAQEMPVSVSGKTYSVTLTQQDMGYIIEDGIDRFYCWVVNYANHQAVLSALDIAPEQDCDRTRLTLSGQAEPITYYSINGRGIELDRELYVDYNSMEYDAEASQFVPKSVRQTLPSVQASIGVPAPLCDTDFTLSADRFLRQWGREITITSDFYTTNAVDAHTSAEQHIREADNEQKIDGGALGGSAPVDVTFTAEVSDAAVFRQWQISRDPDFETLDDTYDQLSFDYTFTTNGTTYIRFTADNASGTCPYIGETYEVFIGESALMCPNAFSPGATEGVNDEWRVSYKSIIEFECHIFNRWGQQMCSFTDPATGWDGRYRGKLVPAGVYYYVIKAKGSDGRRYDLSGDINIVRYRTSGSTSASGEETPPAE